jgi:hypothetical protein
MRASLPTNIFHYAALPTVGSGSAYNVATSGGRRSMINSQQRLSPEFD